MPFPKHPRRWLIFAAILGGMLAFLGYRFVQSARETAQAISCENNFKQMVLGFYNYHDTYDSLPPAHLRNDQGEPIHSWRALVEPFLEAGPLSLYNFNEPWDGPENRKLALGLPVEIPMAVGNKTLEPSPRVEFRPKEYRIFCCPTNHVSCGQVAHMVAVTGEETAWPESRRVTFDDITDGLPNTILLVEIAHSDILWSEPRDLRFDLMHFEVNSKKGPSISSPHPQGPAVAFADGAVFRLSEKIPPEVVKAMLTIAGGEKIDREELRRKGWLR